MKKECNTMNTRILAVMFLAGAVCSCSDRLAIDPVKEVDVQISISAKTRPGEDGKDMYVVRKGETVQFDFKGGNTDAILFYSGEIGHEYRYRSRSEAEEGVQLSADITLKTNVRNYNSGTNFFSSLSYVKDPEGYEPEYIASAEWVRLDEAGLRQGKEDATDLTLKYSSTDLCSGGTAMFRIVAKSNAAQNNRLMLRQFELANTETRDYGYELDGVRVDRKKTRKSQIFKAMSLFDDSYRVSSDETAACWASYTPEFTIPEGYSLPVQNSRYYTWNVAELGLRYGEGSGMDWVRHNKVGQNIKCTYDIEVFEPVNPFVMEDGRQIDEPTEAMKKSPSESWIVSRIWNTRKVNRDEPTTVIKIKQMNMVWSYNYTFEETGCYVCTFVHQNQSIIETQQKVTEFKVIVIE